MSNPFATAESSGSSSEPLQPMAFSQAGMPGGTAMPGLAGGVSSAQRGVLFFHIAFKTAALFTYLFLSGVMSYTNTFVIVVILSALDFWTVKNVSGRLLVGLRWSNTIGEDGASTWHFQSFEDQRQIHQVDSNVFWLGVLRHHQPRIATSCCLPSRASALRLFARPAFPTQPSPLPDSTLPAPAGIFVPLVLWTLLAIGCLLTFRFMWLLLVLVALALNAINVIGCKLPPFQHT